MASALVDVVAAAVAVAARGAMREVAVPAQFARLSGSLRGAAVTMNSKRYVALDHGLTVATIHDDSDGRLLTVTMVGLPQRECGLPILGVDLIGLRGSGMPLVAIDLAPTCAVRWAIDVEPILADLAGSCAQLTRRKPPQFAAAVFSPAALIASARPEQVATVCAAAADVVARWALLPSVEYPETSAAVARWCGAELGNRKEHDALAAMFGREVAGRYLEQWLFAPGALTGGAAPRWQECR
jgi:Ferredoxin-dependent bilin reductase